MSIDWEKLVKELESCFWSAFSETVIDHAKNPRNLGNIQDESSYAYLTGQCGDTIQIWVKIEEDMIKEITFWTDGCGTTIASGSMVTELAKGKNIADALQITPLEVLEALGGLPDESVHCAILATNTLQEALKKYQRQCRENKE
ncbi:MAG: iron-sulfur cluster assembly scaffold protein [Peptococcaceae bacterium]